MTKQDKPSKYRLKNRLTLSKRIDNLRIYLYKLLHRVLMKGEKK